MGHMLRITHEEIDDKILLRLDGRLDISSAPLLEKKLEEFSKEGYLAILLDCTEMDYLSSAGLRTLLAHAKKAKEARQVFALFSLQDDVAEIIKMVGFERLFSICKTEKEALSLSLP